MNFIMFLAWVAYTMILTINTKLNLGVKKVNYPKLCNINDSFWGIADMSPIVMHVWSLWTLEQKMKRYSGPYDANYKLNQAKHGQRAVFMPQWSW